MNINSLWTRNGSIPAIVLLTVLTARKFGLPFTGISLLVSLFYISLLFIARCFNGSWNQRTLELLCLICLVLVTPRLLVSYSMPVAAKTGAMIASLVLAYQLYFIRSEGMPRPLTAVVLLVVLAAGYPETGSYHRWFRQGTFESYVTAHFPPGDELAYSIALSNAQKVTRPEVFQQEKSEQAKQYEEKRDCQSALTTYDEWLDALPDAAEGYLRRGRLRLYGFKSNPENALAAVKDFTRAILLDSTIADAYFYRAQANCLIEPRQDICQDLETSLRLDTMRKASVMEMAAGSCPELSGRLFPGPAYP